MTASSDGSYHIQPSSAQSGKWADIAKKFGKENFFGGEVGDELKKSISEFKDNLSLGDA